MKRVAIFASGAGSNAAKIIEYFNTSSLIQIALIVCNKPNAGVLNIANKHAIPSLLIEKDQFFRGDAYVEELKKCKIDFIVLAGFLWLIPKNILQAYPGRIINIHPAILPKFGGKGMYGDFVHKAVMEAQEPEGGITIHYVNENYDEGEYIYQARYKIDKGDNLEMVKFKGQQLEHLHYPRIVDSIIKKIKK